MISKQTILNFLQQEADITEIEDDAPLFSSGLIDSFSLVSLMSFIEDTGNIRISPAEVNLEHFDSIDRIIAYLQTKS